MSQTQAKPKGNARNLNTKKTMLRCAKKNVHSLSVEPQQMPFSGNIFIFGCWRVRPVENCCLENVVIGNSDARRIDDTDVVDRPRTVADAEVCDHEDREIAAELRSIYILAGLAPTR